VIVDTDVLIDLMQGGENAEEIISRLEKEHVPLRISSVSQFELYHSVERVNNPGKRRRNIEKVLETRFVYPADGPVMKKAGRIDGRLTADGQAIGISDTIIAATALVHEESILTRNIRHFERVSGLDIESY